MRIQDLSESHLYGNASSTKTYHSAYPLLHYRVVGVRSRHERGQTAPPFTAKDYQIQSGDVQLSARLYAPPGKKEFPVVVLVTGSGNESVLGEVYTQVIAKAFAKEGIGALAYDKRGTGNRPANSRARTSKRWALTRLQLSVTRTS